MLLTKNFKTYQSNSQKIRVFSEDWVRRNIFCPSCGSKLKSFENNRPVADFFCSSCPEQYELKSKKDSFGYKIVDGAYSTMIERVQSKLAPNFFLLNYNIQDYSISNFFVIPKHFFIPDVIEQRKPLSTTAKRAGWVGCNILLKSIPCSGKIFYIDNYNLKTKPSILKLWNKTLFLHKEKSATKKGWLLDIMNCIDIVGKNEFTLNDLYKFEKPLLNKHPNNIHIKDKIRQQLQLLRDRGYLQFIGNGNYRLL